MQNTEKLESKDSSMKSCNELKCVFVDPQSNKTLEVKIPQVLDGRYGMYVWPSAPVLAQYVWHHRTQIQMQNPSILEIGAGTALPGIVAAKIGARVTLSDACHLQSCRENSKSSCRVNNVHNCKVIGVTWGQINTELVTLGSLDVILGSDCFYDTKDFEDILVTVSYLLKKNPLCQFWTSYQERSSDRSLEPLLVKWGLRCRHVPLSSFMADSSNIAGSNLPGCHTIHLIVITGR